MSKTLDNIYILVFLVNIESVLLLALVKYMLCSHFIKNCILLYFLEAKNLYFVMKNCWKCSYICVLTLPKKRLNWFHNNLHNSGMAGRRKLPTPRWIAVLMLYWLMYNIPSYFNELILAWSAYVNEKWLNMSKVSLCQAILRVLQVQHLLYYYKSTLFNRTKIS